MSEGLLSRLLGAPLDNARSHLDCVLDACAPPSPLALSRCGWRLHLALTPYLKKAEQTSEAKVYAHFGMVDLTQLTALRTLTWKSRLPAAQCRHLGTWLRVGGQLEGVAKLSVRQPAGDEEEDEDEHEQINLLLFRSDATRNINLCDTDIDDELMITLAHAMGSMANLQELFLAGNQIGDAGMQAFADAIGKGSIGALEYLNLAVNEIGDAGLQALAGVIGNGSMGALERLGLSSNQIGDAGLQSLAGAIGNGSLRALTYLDLEHNQIGDPGMIEFSRSIAIGSMELTTLQLGVNNIMDDGLVMLIPHFKAKLSKLTVFSIGSGITDVGMRALSDEIAIGSMGNLNRLFINDPSQVLKDACASRNIRLNT